ncbi:glycosyltransferase family 2 protein, partial [Isoptericola sp. NPDC060257]|uniref:glycosyltransferase family 2 protein n=1 Tax=Isoptericola sp. NPDC060257 TaxID=3347087 RepID=UPI003659FA7D
MTSRGSAARSAAGPITPRVTVLVPAHDEEEALPRTLRSLADQTLRPGRVVVVADNCSDATTDVARAHGADVVETSGNRDRKAGALNQALRRVRTDLVLVLDADTTITPRFVEDGLRLLDSRPSLGAVGGVFEGESPRGYLQGCQANEYERYGVQVDVTRRTSVLTGTAALIRREALEEVARERGSRLPGVAGDVYDRAAITEDSELTLALRTLGYELA